MIGFLVLSLKSLLITIYFLQVRYNFFLLYAFLIIHLTVAVFMILIFYERAIIHNGG